MPFNDYWPDGELSAAPDKMGFGWIKSALVGLVVILGLAGWWMRAHGWGWGATIAGPIMLGIAVVGVTVFALYRMILREGPKPFPTAPNSDLPSILKALFIQRNFIEFAIEAQGLGDDALHASFGRFVAAVQPKAPRPALVAGECHAKIVEWT